MAKLVSVIIPAYNHENYVQETIWSIINQTYQNIELIIIDDGSKDCTFNKIEQMKEECLKRFVRFEYETQENMGTCRTLNKLLSKTNGDYIYIIASDDAAKPFAIEKEVYFLENNPDYALCVGDNEIIDSQSKVCYWDKKNNLVYEKSKAVYKTFCELLQRRKRFKFTSKKFGTYETLYTGNYIPNGYLIDKKVFDEVEFTPLAPLEDYFLMLQISKKYKMKYLPEVLFSYRQHGTNTVLQQERMELMKKNTMEHEETILKNIDESIVFSDIIRVRDQGVLYKKQGIPFFFQILSYVKINKKIKIFKLLNIKIFEITGD